MGQGASTPPPSLTPDQLTTLLTSRFASKCFTPLELYSFKDNFRTYADDTDGTVYFKEDTLIKFLELPAPCDIGAILFHACSNLGAWPIPANAPAILDFEALVRVVTLMLGREGKVLKKRPERTRLLFRAFAVWERVGAKESKSAEEEASAETGKQEDAEKPDEDETGYDSDESDDLVLDELVGGHEHAEVSAKPSKEDIETLRRAQIPLDSLRKLVQFLLIIQPLGENQPISELADRFTPQAIEELQPVVDAVMAGFEVPADAQGISYRQFKKTIQTSMPYLLDPLVPLFTHFLFSTNLTPVSTTPPPLAPVPSSSLLTPPVLSQLHLFLPLPPLHPLYAGSTSGFSLNSLTTLTHWRSPTLLLLTGPPIPTPAPAAAAPFLTQLQPSSLPAPSPASRYTFGIYLPTPWQHSHKHHFPADHNTLLFQLHPKHEIYRASHTQTEYAYFNKTDGIGFGAPLQDLAGTHRGSPYFRLGPVSLVVEPTGLEYAVFTHSGHGGSFEPAGEGRWQVRMEVEEVEVWGVGGEVEVEEQKRRREWEEREAKKRREINVGKGDVEADRALLEMAGLVGQNRSGGSMG